MSLFLTKYMLIHPTSRNMANHYEVMEIDEFQRRPADFAHEIYNTTIIKRIPEELIGYKMYGIFMDELPSHDNTTGSNQRLDSA